MSAPDLEAGFDHISSTLAQAAGQRDSAVASSVAEAWGLRELGDGKPSQHHVWERMEGDLCLRFEWRWYDQSKAFSIQPDMNILTVSLRRGDQVIRSASERYED